MSSILDKITMVALTDDQFYNEDKPKTQIYLHHTAGNANPYSTMKHWRSTSERVATAFIVGGKFYKTVDADVWKDGEILQAFGSGKWAHHLGLTKEQLKGSKKTNLQLNQNSIGIEICNWGQLTKTARGFETWAKTLIPESEVVEYTSPYKGFKFYHRYTTAQIDTTKELLEFLCQRWGIPTNYKGNTMFFVDNRALRGESGVWTHTSVRPDKFDCHPQKELIDALSSL